MDDSCGEKALELALSHPSNKVPGQAQKWYCSLRRTAVTKHTHSDAGLCVQVHSPSGFILRGGTLLFFFDISLLVRVRTYRTKLGTSLAASPSFVKII